MTDNEIMTTLRRCADHACYRCTEYGKEYCRQTIAALAWDLMYRQKAEIEDLGIKNEHLVCFLAEARKDVSKEFAEKLHKYIDNFREKREMVMLPYTEAALLCIEKCIDSIVKEMTEGK